MTIAYVVTAGDYSDYQIYAIFSTKENAQLFIDLPESPKHAAIEEYEIDQVLPPPGTATWNINITKQGEILPTSWVIPPLQKSTDGSSDYFLPHVEIGMILSVFVLARNKEHAIKIAAERHAQVIAEGRWKEKP